MKLLPLCRTVAIVLCLSFPLARCGGASGQVVDNPGFKALPRPICYSMPLAPVGGANAVIVYGRDAAWTRNAAESVQKSIQDWSGVKLDLADDHTVTSDESWLLNDAYLKTPLIVLGNARDNRVMHALGTRYLLQSNRTWPGGDRFVIRSIFEPFVADVNYVVLEASTQAGLDGAAVKFAALVKGLPKDATAALPRLREVGFGKDAWGDDANPWMPPAEYLGPAGRSISEIALAAVKKSPGLNSFETGGMLDNQLRSHVCGGRFGNGAARLSSVTPDQVRHGGGDAVERRPGRRRADYPGGLRGDGGDPRDPVPDADGLVEREGVQRVREFPGLVGRVSELLHVQPRRFGQRVHQRTWRAPLGLGPAVHGASAGLRAEPLPSGRQDPPGGRAAGGRRPQDHGALRPLVPGQRGRDLPGRDQHAVFLRHAAPGHAGLGPQRQPAAVGGLLHHDQRQHAEQLAAGPGRLRGTGHVHRGGSGYGQGQLAWAGPGGGGGFLL